VNLYVEPGHPDAGAPLLRHLARALAELGGEVVIKDGDDNLVRARRPGDPGHRPWVVVASGLPNLLHEVVHALLFGRLADDHGFDYNKIPLDLADAGDRRLLWEELACCVVSCAYGEPAAADAWFKEQVEIQGVFHGVPDDVGALAQRVEGAVAEHPEELAATVAEAYAAVERALLAAGAQMREILPMKRWSFGELWARYRAPSAVG
jgi:hypothetical protein